jgi:hypothetical protein
LSLGLLLLGLLLSLLLVIHFASMEAVRWLWQSLFASWAPTGGGVPISLRDSVVEVAEEVGEERGGDAEPPEVQPGVPDAEATESAQDDGEDDEHDDEHVHDVS